MSDLLKTMAASHVWAMDRVHLSALIRAAQEVDLGARLATMQDLTDEDEETDPCSRAGVEILGDLALVPVQGPIVKEVPAWWRAFDCQACGMVELQAALRDLALRDEIRQVLLVVDSPGGTVSGVSEASDTVRRLGQMKPVHAAISDLGASAAYWIACQAKTVSANATAHVGSIGVYTYVADTHRAYESQGVDVTLIASGPEKGAGLEGTKLTAEQIAGIRENVEDLAAAFAAEVSRGRRLLGERLDAVTTGRTWIAPRARALGLVDHVETLADTISRLQA